MWICTFNLNKVKTTAVSITHLQQCWLGKNQLIFWFFNQCLYFFWLKTMDWFDLLQLTLMACHLMATSVASQTYLPWRRVILSHRIFALNCDCSVSKNIRISTLHVFSSNCSTFFLLLLSKCFHNKSVWQRDTIISMLTVLHYLEVIYSLRKLMSLCALLVCWLLLTIHLNSMRCNEPHQ